MKKEENLETHRKDSGSYEQVSSGGGDMATGEDATLNLFLETVRRDPGYKLYGRMLRDKEDLVIFVDDVGRFSIPVRMVMNTILGLGEGEVSGQIPGICRLSENEKGLNLDIDGTREVTPVARVRAVIGWKSRMVPFVS